MSGFGQQQRSIGHGQIQRLTQLDAHLPENGAHKDYA
jgi:hypothetical protein